MNEIQQKSVLSREFSVSLPSHKAEAALSKEHNYAFELDSVLNKTVTFEELNRETGFRVFQSSTKTRGGRPRAASAAAGASSAAPARRGAGLNKRPPRPPPSSHGV